MERRAHEQANERGARRFRSVLLGWTDPASGEEVLIDVTGSARHLVGIEQEGFVILRSDETPSSDGRESRPPADAVSRTAMGASDHGDPRRPNRRAIGS